MKVIEFPAADVRDVPRGLRALADKIEADEYGEPYFLAWVLDCEQGMTLGGLGGTAEPGAVAHLLFAVAQRKLEGL